MEEYSFENEKSEVSFVDYLGLDEDEQIEDTSGITQVCMDRDLGDEGDESNTNEDRHISDSDDNHCVGDAGYTIHMYCSFVFCVFLFLKFVMSSC